MDSEYGEVQQHRDKAQLCMLIIISCQVAITTNDIQCV